MHFRPSLHGKTTSSSHSDHRPFEGTRGILEGRKDVMNEAKDAADRKIPRPNSDVDIRNATGGNRDHSLASKLKLWGFRDSRKPFQVRQLILPFTLLRFPTILFAGVLVGGVLSWYNVVGGSLALILGSAPYNFSPNVIGLFYLASVIGVSIGCLITGWASDALPLWVSRRRGGVMEPEHRLWLFVVAIVAHPVGCFFYGVGASYRIHWIGIAFGVGAISLTLPLGTSLAFTYVLDSFEEVSGEGFVSVILIRNSMGKWSINVDKASVSRLY
ncbi:putative MFS-type transporter [Colletotrichum trifolii]|uniref:Putative MFS-type transporter n=1 Tax=Colletotrichum trifolii TaxID=5466 RepID=A0A4R8QAM6_COLTR|nr:putative MFS-type transporter [Colletotrichum trifolii]